MQFLFFCTAVIRAVDKHQGLLRASIAHAANDHRLGANEAPPAIISIFLGDQLTEIFDQIEVSGTAKAGKDAGLLGLGSPVLPNLPRHAGDRNRTSPFAFTGNKFEFRAVGASQSISFPATVLNTVMAESIDELCTELEAELERGITFEEALKKLLASEIKAHKRIIFNGDNYTEEWQQEAARRGLLNLRNTLDSLDYLEHAENVKIFETYGVLSRRELESRHEIALDQYFKTINIEGETTAHMGQTMILPAAIRYLNELLAVADRGSAHSLQIDGTLKTIGQVNDLVNELAEALGVLIAKNAESGGDDVSSKAYHMRDQIIPAMQAVRSVADQLEKFVPDDFWPLPTYRDMLFVK
jgi:glutamine synthetase